MQGEPDAGGIGAELAKQKKAIEGYQREFRNECKKFLVSTAENKTHITIILSIVFVIVFVILTIDERMRNRVIPKMDEYAKKHNQQLFDQSLDEKDQTLFTMYNQYPISVVLILFTFVALFLSVVKYSKLFRPIQKIITKRTWIVRTIALLAMMAFFNYLVISSTIFGIFYFDLPSYSQSQSDLNQSESDPTADDNILSYLFASESASNTETENEDTKLRKEIADSFFFFGSSIITHIFIFFILSYVMFVFKFD